MSEVNFDPIDPEKLAEDVSINDTDLTGAMMTQSSLYIYYARQTALAQRKMDRAKIKAELTESRVHDRLTRQTKADGEKVVESAIAKQILRDSEYLRAHMALADAKMVHAMAKEALEAFKQRRDMLVQLGVQAREELKGDLRIKAAQESSNLRQRVVDNMSNKTEASEK